MFSPIDEFQLSHRLEDARREAEGYARQTAVRRALRPARPRRVTIARLARFRGVRISVKWAPREGGLAT
jgi:hypothetical protein